MNAIHPQQQTCNMWNPSANDGKCVCDLWKYNHHAVRFKAPLTAMCFTHRHNQVKAFDENFSFLIHQINRTRLERSKEKFESRKIVEIFNWKCCAINFPLIWSHKGKLFQWRLSDGEALCEPLTRRRRRCARRLNDVIKITCHKSLLASLGVRESN